MKLSIRTLIAFIGLVLVSANYIQAQDDSAEKTFTISGNVGISGVELVGLPGNPVTGRDGTYSAIVPFGWTGTVTPIKEGYNFEPASLPYQNVIKNLPNGNYTPKLRTFTISGEVGETGVIMRGLPGDPITDRDGTYNVTVEYGWSGIVTPVKKGFEFEPPLRQYSRLSREQINNRYIARPEMLTVSGIIAIGDRPLEGVLLSANNGGGSDFTDSQGRYSVEVPYGWSGEISISKQGLVFDPPSTSYRNVTENFDQGKPVPRQSNPSSNIRSPQRGLPKQNQMTTVKVGDRKVIVIPSMDVKAGDFEATMEDMRVMLQILEDKVINEPSMIRGILMDYGDFFGQNNRTSKAVYIQGYGVLFLMEVDFPLVFQSEPQQEQTEQAEGDIDPVWQEAREQVFSPKDETQGMMSGVRPESIQQRVEQLKKEFIRALKHASNIRNLGQDEWVILNVTGWGQRSGRFTSFGASEGRMNRSGRAGGGMYGGMGDRMMGMDGMGVGIGSSMGGGMGGRMGGFGSGGGFEGGYGGGGGGYGGGGGMMGGGGFIVGGSSSTVLTIRANKSIIDAFAKDEIDFEQFQQQVDIFVY